MPRVDLTEIVFVVDRSGSMSVIAADMCGGFDTFIEEQKKLPGECLVTLAQFDSAYELVYTGKPIADVPPLTLVPRGATALLDAVGRTVDAVGERLGRTAEEDRPGKVLFVIVTDGLENVSLEYSRERVFKMIKHQQEKYSWDFIYLGANQDAISVADGMGISAGNTVNYVACAGAAASGALRGLSHNVSTMRSGKGLGDLQATYDSLVTGKHGT